MASDRQLRTRAPRNPFPYALDQSGKKNAIDTQCIGYAFTSLVNALYPDGLFMEKRNPHVLPELIRKATDLMLTGLDEPQLICDAFRYLFEHTNYTGAAADVKWETEENISSFSNAQKKLKKLIGDEKYGILGYTGEKPGVGHAIALINGSLVDSGLRHPDNRQLAEPFEVNNPQRLKAYWSTLACPILFAWFVPVLPGDDSNLCKISFKEFAKALGSGFFIPPVADPYLHLYLLHKNDYIREFKKEALEMWKKEITKDPQLGKIALKHNWDDAQKIKKMKEIAENVHGFFPWSQYTPEFHKDLPDLEDDEKFAPDRIMRADEGRSAVQLDKSTGIIHLIHDPINIVTNSPSDLNRFYPDVPYPLPTNPPMTLSSAISQTASDWNPRQPAPQYCFDWD